MEQAGEDGESTTPPAYDQGDDREKSEAAEQDERRVFSVPVSDSMDECADSAGLNNLEATKQVVEWLSHFVSLAARFHPKQGCKFHQHVQDGKFLTKLILNYYCTTCKEGPLCQYGKEGKHASHRVLKTKVLAGRICVELESVMEVASRSVSFALIQTYATNGKIVLCLKRKRATAGAAAPKNTRHRCVQCLENISKKDEAKEVKFCSIECKIEYANINSTEQVWGDMQLPAPQGLEEGRGDLKKMLCGNNNKKRKGKPNKPTTRCKQIEDKAVQGKNSKKKHKSAGGDEEIHHQKKCVTRKLSKAFFDEPLKILNLNIKLKTFDVQVPSTMLLDEAFNQIRSHEWKVESFEASLVEEELTKRENAVTMYMSLYSKSSKNEGKSEGEDNGNGFNAASLSSKPMQIFNVKQDTNSFSVILPYDIMVASMIVALMEDFWILVREVTD